MSGTGLLQADREAIADLASMGYDVSDIQQIASDQEAFARRLPALQLQPAPGIGLRTQVIELGGAHFTNVTELRIGPGARVRPVSRAVGFHLPDCVPPEAGLGRPVAAISGSFSFISDDPHYQPGEPCLDLCVRAGQVRSLPTASKWAFFVDRRGGGIDWLPARGRLRIAGQEWRWFGAKDAALYPGEIDEHLDLMVHGAAGCTVRYDDSPITPFVRSVDRATNRTPTGNGVVDIVVAADGAGLRVDSLGPGGGTDLFTRSFVLQGHARTVAGVRQGMPVQVETVGERAAGQISDALSLGPSLAEAAAGAVHGFDASLGVSPFRPVRYARTTVSCTERETVFRIFDGAPATMNFQGITPVETAELTESLGGDAERTFHLDGGASSKIVVRDGGTTHVFGSLHYLRWPRVSNDRFVWDGRRGRVLNSAFSVEASR